MSIILKNSSFGLIRTNPVLTTNIKIVTDGDKVYLESIDADPVLANSKYKKFEVTGGLYSTDLFKFYSQKDKLLPKDIAYKVYERDDYKSIKDSFSKQYDFMYGMGTEYKNSRLYKQEYCTFAPLWVEPSNIPDYFVIFKLRGPLSMSYPVVADQNSSSVLDENIKNPINLFNNYIKDSVIVKTFDLTKRTAIGRYIRNHAENNLFPKYPVLVSIKKDDESSWEGISYDSGGFCKKTKSIYKDYTIMDKTILEKDSFITNGFYDQGVVLSNILNLEYLFDDASDSDYEFNRYFGLYVSESELGQFEIDNSSTYTYSISSLEQKQENNLITNETGVVLAIKLTNGSDKISFDSSSAKFSYVKDTKNNFYSVDRNINYDTIQQDDVEFIKIKNKNINLSDFYDYGVPFKYVDVFTNNVNSASNFSFKVIGTPELGDQIRIKNVSYEEDITKYYTITAVDLPNGTNEGTGFSVNGSIYDIAKSIANAINYIEIGTNTTQQFVAVSIEDRVVVYTRTKNSYLNRIKYTIFSKAEVFPFTIPNEFGSLQKVFDYLDYPGSTNYLTGNLFSYHFTGGTDLPASKFFIKQSDLFEMQDEENPIFIKNFIKTEQGFKEITDYSSYIEEPIKNTKGEIIGFNGINDYFTCYVDEAKISIGVSKKLSLYHIQKNTNGYFSIFPIKDFDFDSYSTEYSKSADSYINRLNQWYLTSSDSYLYGITGATGIIDTWYNSEFNLNGGFKNLTGLINDTDNIISSINSEYDRLQENILSELSLDSRVVPYINKWVYDNDAKDVRENNYRLNTNLAFGYSNFSPSFTSIKSDPSLFTHEWYYLQKYPSYFNYEDKLNSFSYFEDEIDPVQLYDINSDYFLSYFTRESIGGTAVPRDFRYSIFEYSSDSTYPETLFRGVKVLVKDRLEYSHLNNDANSKKFIINPAYNDYKFSAILTFGEIGTTIEVIKNEKYKNITTIIKAALDDPFLWNSDHNINNPSRFIDRVHLYTLKNNYEIGTSGIGVINKPLSGVIQSWEFVIEDSVNIAKVKLVKDEEGRTPNLINEMSLGENGFYNDIVIIAPDGWLGNLKYLRFSDIIKCDLDTFWCYNIYYDNTFDGSNIKKLETDNSKKLYFYDINYDGSPSTIPDIIPNELLWFNEHPTVKKRVKNLILGYNPIYVNGGYSGLENIIKEISFASISEKINNGDPKIKYTTVYVDGTTASDTFSLEFIKPSDEMTSSYLTLSDITRDTSYLQNFTGILGYKLSSASRTVVQPISRQKGGYTPKFKDLIQFVDYPGIDPIYENTRIYTNGANYGIISNLNYNKVNAENSSSILKMKKYNEIYPYIGEISIDKKDFFIFKSNFDPVYYTQHNTLVKSSTLSGLTETKESKSFFGSKVLSTPYSIRIQNFEGLVDKSVIGNANVYSTDYTVIKSYTDFGSSNQLTLDIYVDKLLINYFMKDGISEDFYKYFGNSLIYTNEKTLEDFVKKYIKDNILDKYIIKGITFWEKFYSKGTIYNEIETSLTDQEKISSGYSNTKNFAVTYKSDLNINLKYNIPVDKNYSISFSLEIEKK